MNLQEYDQQIDEVFASKLPPLAKAAALNLLSNEIMRCLWQPWAKNKALALASKADELAKKLGGASLEGLDLLAQLGLLNPV